MGGGNVQAPLPRPRRVPGAAAGSLCEQLPFDSSRRLVELEVVGSRKLAFALVGFSEAFSFTGSQDGPGGNRSRSGESLKINTHSERECHIRESGDEETK